MILLYSLVVSCPSEITCVLSVGNFPRSDAPTSVHENESNGTNTIHALSSHVLRSDLRLEPPIKS